MRSYLKIYYQRLLHQFIQLSLEERLQAVAQDLKRPPSDWKWCFLADTNPERFMNLLGESLVNEYHYSKYVSPFTYEKYIEQWDLDYDPVMAANYDEEKESLGLAYDNGCAFNVVAFKTLHREKDAYICFGFEVEMINDIPQTSLPSSHPYTLYRDPLFFGYEYE